MKPKPKLAWTWVNLMGLSVLYMRHGNIATVVYCCDYAQEYHQITGAVRKVDPYWKLLQIGNMPIDFCEIAEIEKVAISVLQ